jgi:hypothetical protein
MGDDRGSCSTTRRPQTSYSASGTVQNIEALTAKHKTLVSDICSSSVRVQTAFRQWSLLPLLIATAENLSPRFERSTTRDTSKFLSSSHFSSHSESDNTMNQIIRRKTAKLSKADFDSFHHHTER